MKREKGEIIEPHVHNEVNREIVRTQEVLIVRSGKVQVDLYNGENLYWGSFTLGAGDLVLLAFGGHGFTMLETTEILVIKQGPYLGDQGKVRFAGHHSARPEDQSRFQSANPYLTAERKNCSHGV